MGVFYIELIPTRANRSFFTCLPHELEDHKFDEKSSYQHSRFIEFSGKPAYSQFGDFSTPSDLRMTKDENIIPMPPSSSVLIRDNSTQEELKICQYLESENTSELQIVIDYNSEEFAILWEMFFAVDKRLLTAKVCISADLNSEGFYRDIKIPENKKWVLESFLIQESKSI